MAYTFGKDEKLCSQSIIDMLFASGNEVKLYPFVVKFLETELIPASSIQVAIAVPKKRIKSAVKRNLIRRRIKEAYRLNNQSFKSKYRSANKGLALFIVFTGPENTNYETISTKLVSLLNKLNVASHD